MGAAERATAWELFGDPTRRRIVEMLAAGPRAVSDLAAELPVSRPAVSQHLKVLKSADLVQDEVVGRRRIYRIDVERLTQLREQLDSFWSAALTNLAESTLIPTDDNERSE